MASIRKRKINSVEDTLCSSQTSIKAFGAISKTTPTPPDAKKRKSSQSTPMQDIHLNTVQQDTVNKRKRTSDSGAADEEPCQAREGVFKQFAKKKRNGMDPTNKWTSAKDQTPLSPMGTPSKRAMAMLNRLNLDSITPIPFALQPEPMAYNTPPRTPILEACSLPEEVQQLQALYAAFVSALAFCFAHSGTATSVELNVLLRAVTSNWKKGMVDLEDIRRLLAFDRDSFQLEYCGQAGVRLTMLQSQGRHLIRGTSMIDVDGLQSRFTTAVVASWSTWSSSTVLEFQSAPQYIAQLPLADVRKNEAALAAEPFSKRGQRRLADLKAAQLAASEITTAQTSSDSMHLTRNSTVQNRGTNLLDRVLARQATNASLPAGPTREQQERRAALHRIEDVTRVLNLLAGNKLRASFSMISVTQHLQQSLRNPIGRPEIERCLSLMAEEITPGFVQVVQSGNVKCVVVNRKDRISLDELRARVASTTA